MSAPAAPPAPANVALAATGAPRYDHEVMKLLAPRCERLEYYIIGGVDGHASLTPPGDHASVHIVAADVGALRDAAATAGAGVPSEGFDLVHTSCWKASGDLSTSQLLDSSYSVLRQGGTLVAWNLATAGVFNLRAIIRSAMPDDTSELPEVAMNTWLREQGASFLAGRNNMSVGAEPPAEVLEALRQTLVPSSLPEGWRSWLSARFLVQDSAAASSAAPMVWREQVDSQLDMTRSVDDPADAFGQGVLSEVWGVNAVQLATQNPQMFDDALGDLAECTLYPAGNSAPVLVHAPLTVAQIMRPPTSAQLASQPEDCLVLPLLPVDPFLAAAAAAPSPAQNAEGMLSFLQRHPDIVADPHANVRAAPVRGPFGHFLGTGAGPVPACRVVAQTFAADDARALTERATGVDPTGQVAVSVAAPISASSAQCAPGIWCNSAAEDVRQLRALASARNPWFPLGPGGSFFNVGLATWHALREAWTARSADAAPHPPPPPVDTDQVYEELAVLRRSYELPGPMSLRDVVGLLVEIWEEEQYYQ